MPSPRYLNKSQYPYSKMLLLVAVLLANSVKAWQIATKVTTLRPVSKLHLSSPFGGDEQEKEAMIGRYMEEKGMSKEEAETEYKAFKTNPYYSLEKVGISCFCKCFHRMRLLSNLVLPPLNPPAYPDPFNCTTG